MSGLTFSWQKGYSSRVTVAGVAESLAKGKIHMKLNPAREVRREELLRFGPLRKGRIPMKMNPAREARRGKFCDLDLSAKAKSL